MSQQIALCQPRMNVLLNDRNQWALVKPSSKKNGGKVKRSFKVSVEVALAKTNRAPNMSRKNQGATLYPFPSFDKCDSLLFFPSTFASCLNSGDFVSLSKLLKSRVDNSCDINVAGRPLTVDMVVKVHEIMNELHPDSMICVHTTKVVGNEIRTLLYFKYTDSTTIRKSLMRTCADPDYVDMCSPRGDPNKLSAFLDTKPEQERAVLSHMLEHQDEVLVYGRAYMTMTFDDFTKKVTGLHMECEFTSFCETK